jgi:predicted nucleotidyltransferase
MTAALAKILTTLSTDNIEYILVGGMAAVLHGAPVTTQDIDIVHRRTPENVARLLAFLKQTNARYRGQPKGRILFPTEEVLLASGHNNLTTDLGPIDILCELAPGQGYEQLLPHTVAMESEGTAIKVVTLEKLIEIKTETGRAKDRLMLPVLMKLLKR